MHDAAATTAAAVVVVVVIDDWCRLAVGPQVAAGHEPRGAIRTRRLSAGHEQAQAGVLAETMFGGGELVPVVMHDVVAVQDLVSCAGPDQEGDAVVELRLADAGLGLRTDLVGPRSRLRARPADVSFGSCVPYPIVLQGAGEEVINHSLPDPVAYDIKRESLRFAQETGHRSGLGWPEIACICV